MTFRLPRTLAVAGVALAVALALAGCTAVQNVTGHLAGQTMTPRVGDCWQVTYADAAQSEDWEGTGNVACSTRHESYTYAVTKLTTKFTGSWLDAKGNVRSDVDTAAFQACLAQEKKLLPGITPKEALFYPTYYVPSVAQWNNGARWVRCDMTEIKVGSEVAKPVLAALPAAFSTVVTELTATPAKFALCEDDVYNNGPDGDGTTYADCTKPNDWTFTTRLTLPGGSSTAYPGAAALKSRADTACAAAMKPPAGHVIAAIPPTKTDWVQSDVRTVDCWLDNN